MKHLIITTSHGDRYRVNEQNQITQYKNKKFFSGWIFRGITLIKNYNTPIIPAAELTEEKLKQNFHFVKDLQYKNGKGKYTVCDIDHGTSRVWASERITYMYYENVD